MIAPRRLSILRRLAVAITLVLCLSLLLGSALTYWHVVAKVGTELRAALSVGTRNAAKAVEGSDGMAPMRRLTRIVESFDGDRHLVAILTAADGHIVARSKLSRPEEPAPDWFTAIVVGQVMRADVTLPTPYDATGTLALQADPHNEVAEAWSDLLLTVAIMALFFSLVLALLFWSIRGALRPLRDLRVGLSRIGAGDYTTRMTADIYSELEPLRVGFDTMAEQLDAMRSQNEDLHAQILNLQEEERAELARDLHDDVAPFLFSVGADAAMIRQYLIAGATAQVGPRAEAIAESARHMQKHLKGVLRRLAPETLIDLGLAGAVDNLVAFWKQRRPGVAFTMDLTENSVEPPLDAVVFRVIQESLSNAVRHADPTRIDVTLRVEDGRVVVRIEDDGAGFSNAPFGFGLSGMRERVKAVGGQLVIQGQTGGRGVVVEAILPFVDHDERIKAEAPA